jgi:hypothetical protein
MRDPNRIDPSNAGRPHSPGGKLLYAKPKLQEYGSIAKLTMSGSGSKSELVFMMSCL